MELHEKMFIKLNPRQFKFLAIIVIGIIGIAIALGAYIFSENQTIILAEVGRDLFYSPVGSVIVSITSFLFC